MELNGGGFASWEIVWESCKHWHNNMHIQAGYPEPCKIPVSNSCKACMCLLNSVPRRRQLPLDHWLELAIRNQSLAVVKDTIEENMADRLLCHRRRGRLFIHLCQAFLIMVLRTPCSAGFQFSQLGTGYFSWHKRWMQLTSW